MRILYFILVFGIVACGAETEPNTTTDSSGEDFTDTSSVDTSSFEYFKDNFPALTYPITFDSAYLWDGEFYSDEEDRLSKVIPYYLLKSHISDQYQGQNEFVEYLNDNAQALSDPSDYWRNCYYGGYFSENEHNYLIVYSYEKTSEVNGAYYYYQVLEYDKYDQLVDIITLGREGLYTSAYNEIDKETDEEYWKRYTTDEAMTVEITEGPTFKACQLSRFEAYGDLDLDLLSRVGTKGVVYDSLNGYFYEYLEPDCVEY